MTPFVATFPSLPSVLAPPGFPSSSFASSFPQLSSLALTFPVRSPFVTSVALSLPSPAPPGFPVAPPFSPLAPAVGLRHPIPSLTPSVAPYSFPVSSLLLFDPAASSPFLPSLVPAPAVSLPCAPVASSSSFPFSSAPLADTVISWPRGVVASALTSHVRGAGFDSRPG